MPIQSSFLWTVNRILQKKSELQCLYFFNVGGGFFRSFAILFPEALASCECGTIRTRITPNMDTFYAIFFCDYKWVALRECCIHKQFYTPFCPRFISLDGFEVPNLNSYGTVADLLFQIEETHLELCQISVMEHLCVRVCSTSVTAWKVSTFAVFLVRIFPHSDWIRKIRTRRTPNTDTFHAVCRLSLTLSWRKPLSYRNQSIDLIFSVMKELKRFSISTCFKWLYTVRYQVQVLWLRELSKYCFTSEIDSSSCPLVPWICNP